MEGLLTVEQVAEKLQVSKITVYRLLELGKLKDVKIGRVWRISIYDLEAYVEGLGTNK